MSAEELKKKLPGLEENVPLKDHTTFQIGGPAKYFFVAQTKEDLIQAIRIAKALDLPFFILGGGSNLLVSDNGYNGLVIKLQTTNYKLQTVSIVAEAGIELKNVVNLALKNSLTGFEWAAGIPGTLGGAIRGNAGAFDSWMADVVVKAETFDAQELKIRELSNDKCQFGHKTSVFKQNPNLIILSAEIQLERGEREKIQSQVDEYLNLRERKHPLDFPSAGCVFENCQSRIENPRLLQEFPELEQFNAQGTIPIGFLIDKCGLKGKTIGQAQISQKHANFIINLGSARAEDVVSLIKLAKTRVKQKFGLDIEEEIHYLGFF